MKTIYECDDIIDVLEIDTVRREIDQIILMLKSNEPNNELFVYKIDSIISKVDDTDKTTVGIALYKLFAYHKRNSLKITVKMCFGLESIITVKMKHITKKAVIEKTEHQISTQINLDNLEVNSFGKFVYTTDFNEPSLLNKELIGKEIIDPEVSREDDKNYGKYVEQTIGELEHSYYQWRISDIDFDETAA